MALARYQLTVTDDAGNVIEAVSVTVRREVAGSPLATLYTDREGATPAGNPVTTDAEGFAAFHVAGGAYRIDAVKGDFSRTWRFVGIGTAAEKDVDNLGAIAADDITADSVSADVITAGYLDLPEATEPATPPADTVRLFAIDGGVLRVKDAVGRVKTLAHRETLTANRIYYVRTDGSDSNTGLVNNAGGAFLTVQKAYDVVASTLDLADKKVTIQIGAGTYTAGAQAVLFVTQPWVGGKASGGVGGVGGGAVGIIGDRTTPGNVIFEADGKHGVFVNCGLPGVLDIAGIKFQDTTGGGKGLFNNASGANVNIADLDFGDFGTGWQMHAAQNCTIFCYDNDYTISGDAAMHALIEVGGRIDLELGTIIHTGTPAFSTAYIRVESGGTYYSASDYSGSATGKRFLARSGGAIQLFTTSFGELGAAALTRLPGDTDGEFSGGTLNEYGGFAGLRVGFSGAPTADKIEIADANFNLDFNGGNPLLMFDSGDYILFARASNAMAFHAGGADRYLIDGSGRPVWQPGSATPATLGTNGQITMTATSNTQLRFSHRGSDGTTRVANLTLA
jgi:hypothetical protein